MKNPFERNYFVYLILNASNALFIFLDETTYFRDKYKSRYQEVNTEKNLIDKAIDQYLKTHPIVEKKVIINKDKVNSKGVLDYTLLSISNLDNLDKIKVSIYVDLIEKRNKLAISNYHIVNEVYNYYTTNKFIPFIYWYIILFYLYEYFKPYKISILIVIIYIPIGIISYFLTMLVVYSLEILKEHFYNVMYSFFSFLKYLIKIIKLIIKFLIFLIIILLILYLIDKTFYKSQYSLNAILWCCQILFNEIMPTSTFYLHQSLKYILYFYIQTIFKLFPEELSASLYPRYAESRDEDQGLNRVLDEDITPISTYWMSLLHSVLDLLSALGRFILENS